VIVPITSDVIFCLLHNIRNETRVWGEITSDVIIRLLYHNCDFEGDIMPITSDVIFCFLHSIRNETRFWGEITSDAIVSIKCC
jgi:hypothetical protein